MFQITADHLPDEMKLFEYTGGKYYLRFKYYGPAGPVQAATSV